MMADHGLPVGKTECAAESMCLRSTCLSQWEKQSWLVGAYFTLSFPHGQFCSDCPATKKTTILSPSYLFADSYCESLLHITVSCEMPPLPFPFQFSDNIVCIFPCLLHTVCQLALPEVIFECHTVAIHSSPLTHYTAPQTGSVMSKGWVNLIT